MDGSALLGALGSIVLAMRLMPFVGEKEYLHVSTVSTVMRDSYHGLTTEKTTTGLSAFTSMRQFKYNIANGYGVSSALQAAARLGRVDALEHLYGIGVVVSNAACVLLAKHGHQSALEWGVRNGAIPECRLTTSVNNAALHAGHVHVFRWCIEQHRTVKMADLECSVQIYGEEHLRWALLNFPCERNIIAVGVGLSNMVNAPELYREVYGTGDHDARGHFQNFVGVFRGGNIEILSYILDKLFIANAKEYAFGVRDYVAELGHRLRFMDDNRGGHTSAWFDERGMSWAKSHRRLGVYFV